MHACARTLTHTLERTHPFAHARIRLPAGMDARNCPTHPTITRTSPASHVRDNDRFAPQLHSLRTHAPAPAS
eukprot:1904979-Alexandrium_andersonii.AAC.1